jgi:hypothetical protein
LNTLYLHSIADEDSPEQILEAAMLSVPVVC